MNSSVWALQRLAKSTGTPAVNDYLWTSDGQCCANWLSVALQSTALHRQIGCVPASDLSDSCVSSEAESSAGVKWIVIIPSSRQSLPPCNGVLSAGGGQGPCRPLAVFALNDRNCQSAKSFDQTRQEVGSCLVLPTCPSLKSTFTLLHGPSI